MGMPRNLFLVRHCESEGNYFADGKGNTSEVERFKARHDSHIRLTNNGVDQARLTAAWFDIELTKIEETFNSFFDRAVVSSYVRAMETAAYIEPYKEDEVGIKWRTSFYLRARDWGELANLTIDEKNKQFPEFMEHERVNPFYKKPPNGESMADLCMRVQRLYDQLHERCDGMNIIVVCHRDVMWAFRILLEEMSADDFYQLSTSKNPKDRIHNAQVLHYSRMDPLYPQKGMGERMNWMRSVCPHNLDLSTNEWKKIEPYRPDWQQLIMAVEKHPRLIT